MNPWLEVTAPYKKPGLHPSFLQNSSLKTDWHGHSNQALLDIPIASRDRKKPMPTPKATLSEDESPTVKLCIPFGKLTRSKLWLNCKPKVKLRRPRGKLTRSRL